NGVAEGKGGPVISGPPSLNGPQIDLATAWGGTHMPKHRTGPCALAATLAFAVASAHAAPPATELLNRLPENAAAAVIIQVQEIVKTPRGIREGWGKDHQPVTFLAGTIPIFPTVERVIVGSKFDPDNPGHSWHAALVVTNKPVSLEMLAERHQGSVEDVGGGKALFVPRIGYVVKLNEELIGVMGSYDRQAVGRWIRLQESTEKPTISSYLRQSARRHPTAHVFMAVDTEDLINPKDVHFALLGSQQFAGNDRLIATMERYLTRLRGVRFVAQSGDEIRARIILDSSVRATRDLDALKPFFIERLARIGAQLDDLPAATVTMQDNSVTFELNLTDSNLMKIMSLMSSPLLDPNPEDVKTLKLNPEGVSIPASVRFFQGVNRLIDDLRRRNRRATDFTQTALWHDMFAKNIGQLSVLNVDKDVIQ